MSGKQCSWNSIQQVVIRLGFAVIRSSNNHPNSYVSIFVKIRGVEGLGEGPRKIPII